MNPLTLAFLVTLAAYLIGAIPFGFLIARLRGVDILAQGSGNIGATNVGRVLGRRFGILVFLLDFLKGAVPTFTADVLSLRHAEELGPWLGHHGLPVLAGLAAFLGHLFPVYLRFRGGKGVATGAGIVAVLVPIPTAAALLSWVAVVSLYRYVSLASLAAAAVLCATQLSCPDPFGDEKKTLSIFCILAAALVFARHRSNIVRLYHGNEIRIGGGSSVSTLTKTIHAMAVGLWFGSAVFFNLIAALAIFSQFETLATDPNAPERAWLVGGDGPLSPDFARKEQGTQLAGVAVSPLFPRFFLLQGVCGLLVALTAMNWSRALPTDRIHRARSWLAIAALVTVVIGWPLTQKVSHLRYLRYQGDEAVRAAARAEFGTWHLYSLLLSLVTLILVTVLMALVARMPGEAKSV